MTRVGFVLQDFNWLGGVNYYRNLFSAISLLPHPSIHPVLILASQTPESVIATLQHCEIVKTKSFDRRAAFAIFRKGLKRMTGGRDLVLGTLLARNNIDILSHSTDLAWPRNIRTIGWIPDFQHLQLPAFFSAKELARRNREYELIALRCDRIVVSSLAAKQDFQQIAPYAVVRSRILRFVPEIDFQAAAQPFGPLRAAYNLDRDYFFLPNQFWTHKNHALVVEALGILKARGMRPLVLATGNTSDVRSRTHFAELMARIAQLGISDCFRVLGVIPYGDMLGLMKNSIAVINPSLFEGWSSTVEEAKLLGKKVILSDLPVHREQNPKRAIFINPTDAEGLAAAISECFRTKLDEDGRGEILIRDYHTARCEFAQQYEAIVSEVLGDRTKRKPSLAVSENAEAGGA
jgi:glycosyltransferase involved in cell wall biosynthesis